MEAKISTDLSASERAYLRLKEDILAGVIPFGFLDLRIIGDRFRMSVTPVREALARLSAERFVTREVHGYSLATPSPHRLEQLYQISGTLLGLCVDPARRAYLPRPPVDLQERMAGSYAERMNALFNAIAVGQANGELAAYLRTVTERLLPARRHEPDVFDDALQDLETLALLWERRDDDALRLFLQGYHDTRLERVDAIARLLASDSVAF